MRRSLQQRRVLAAARKKTLLSSTSESSSPIISSKPPSNGATKNSSDASLAAETKKIQGTNIGSSKNSTKPADTPPSPEKPTPLAEEPPLTNPFHLLAHATENIDLSSRLRAFSNNFAVIGALWCTLSITALTMAPIDDVYKNTGRVEAEPVVGVSLSAMELRRRRTSVNVPPPDTRIRKPVLVKYFGVPEQYLQDIYMACWSASFFTSAIGLGLSTVVAGIVAATAPAYVKIFVRRHSDILLALPLCQGMSSGFAAVGLSVGLDEARGEPVSWIGYLGTIAGGTIVGRSTLNVLRGYKASRAAGKLSVPTPPKDV